MATVLLHCNIMLRLSPMRPPHGTPCSDSHMQNGSFDDTLSHWDRGLTQEANHLLGFYPADPVPLKQPGQRRLAQACGPWPGWAPMSTDPGPTLLSHRRLP